MFLMFAVAVLTCYIAIEIFRTGIDDGTELLTVSKLISRKEIVFVKLSILFNLCFGYFSFRNGNFSIHLLR